MFRGAQNAQFLALVKVERLRAELVRREHVDDLANVGLGPGDELVDDLAVNLEALPAGAPGAIQVSCV